MPAIRALRFPRAAFDGALGEEASANLLAFLTGKLSDEDLAAFCKMAGIDAGAAMDEPVPFKGMPRTGGGMDARRRARPLTAAEQAHFEERFPHASKIKVSA